MRPRNWRSTARWWSSPCRARPSVTRSPATSPSRPSCSRRPPGSNPVINNASASVPFDTTLVFAPGSTLKSQNASLFVQNQGSALEVLGQATSSQQVNFTSYNDASIGGVSNGNPVTTPRAGDWGGIVFRSYDQAAQPTVTVPGRRHPDGHQRRRDHRSRRRRCRRSTSPPSSMPAARYRRARATSTAPSPCSTPGRRSPTTTSPTTAARAASRVRSAPT